MKQAHQKFFQVFTHWLVNLNMHTQTRAHARERGSFLGADFGLTGALGTGARRCAARGCLQCGPPPPPRALSLCVSLHMGEGVGMGAGGLGGQWPHSCLKLRALYLELGGGGGGRGEPDLRTWAY